MLSQNAKDCIQHLELPYPAVAIRMCFEKPEVPHYDGPP